MATFKFCTECANLLYPKEDRQNHILLFACRNCDYSEEAENPCVYRNDILNAMGENAGITQDLSADPTLPRTAITCPKCSHGQAVFFQSQARRAETKMTLFYVCDNCAHVFTNHQPK